MTCFHLYYDIEIIVRWYFCVKMTVCLMFTSSNKVRRNLGTEFTGGRRRNRPYRTRISGNQKFLSKFVSRHQNYFFWEWISIFFIKLWISEAERRSNGIKVLTRIQNLRICFSETTAPTAVHNMAFVYVLDDLKYQHKFIDVHTNVCLLHTWVVNSVAVFQS